MVPLQCEFFALEGLSQLLKTIELVRANLNPSLEIQGIVLTMFDKRNKLSDQVAADVRQNMGEKVYSTVIPRNVRISEAPSHGVPALVYDLRCPGSQAYIKLAGELIQRERIEAARHDTQGRTAARLGPRPVGADRRRGGADAGRSAGQGQRAPCRWRSSSRADSSRARHFADEELADLAASIREKGVLTPILVRPLGARRL